MDPEELKHRDEVIRTYLLNRDWDRDKTGGLYPEFELMRKMITSMKDDTIYKGVLCNFPFIYDYEYRIEAGIEIKKGDLLLTDGEDNFLVIECKSLKYKTSERKRLARRELEKQLPMMMKILRVYLEECNSIIGIGLTDERNPFYIHVSSRFKQDRLVNMHLPNLKLIEKNPIDALEDFCVEKKISKPEYSKKDNEYQVKISYNGNEMVGISKSFTSIIARYYAAAKLCQKLNIPYDE